MCLVVSYVDIEDFVGGGVYGVVSVGIAFVLGRCYLKISAVFLFT